VPFINLKNKSTIDPCPFVVGFDIRKENDTADCDGHLQPTPIPSETNGLIVALLPELTHILALVVIKLDHTAEFAFIGHGPSHTEVSAIGIPLEFLNGHFGIDLDRFFVRVVFQQQHIARFISGYQT
jgi:hypothetical protein